MIIPFRQYHLFQLLNAFDLTTYPLDLFLRNYFLENRAIGSKDRKEISEAAYGMIRWRGLLDHLCQGELTWERRYELFTEIDPLSYLEKEEIPTNVRLSFPPFLYSLIKETYGKEQAQDICLASNTQAPTTIRVNSLKSTRDDLLGQWSNQYSVIPCKKSATAITFKEKINFFATPEFKAGLFEIQDEGSQLLASLVDVQPKQKVLDYCAGSGGKSLAFAPKMKGSGQIYLHDIRKHILYEARKRLKRAGIENSQLLFPDAPHLKKLKKKMDWVLADAPCTGTGTIRRNPDMKWKFTEEMLKRLVSEQRVIFEKALSFVKPGGHIVFGTCSLLKEENEMQVAHFLKTYPIELVGEPFSSLPTRGGMDGFFGACFRTKK